MADSLVQTVTAEKPTGGSSSGDTTPVVSNIQDLSDGGQHTGDYTISTGGTFGDSAKTTSISGTISVKDSTATASDELVLQNLNIIGTLNVDFGAGNVILNNVTVNGINVTNVGSHSLHVRGNSVIENLTVDDPNNDAHIVVEDNATIAAATVLSGANLEVADTATNAQPFSNITLAPAAAPTTSNQVLLTGTFDTVNVAAPAKVVLAPKAQITAKLIATAPLDFTAPDTATVAKVDIKPSHSTDTFVLSGNLDNVNVNAESNVQVKSGTVKVSSDTKAAVKVTVDQNAIVNTLADSGIVLKGEGKKFTREKSTEAKVAYLKLGNGKVNESTINDLPASVTAKKFLNSLLVSAFANVQIVDSSGNEVNDDTVIDNTMKLKVTAEDGVTVNNYALKFAALPTFEANYPTAAAGEASSRAILVTTKANQPGRVFMIAVPSGAAAPTAAQVKAGINAEGKFVANANYDLKLGEEKAAKIVVDADNTSYDIYVVLLSVNGNLQLKPVKLTATSPIAADKTDYNFTLSGLKYQVENIKKMVDIPVGSNVGECSDQAAKDALIKALSNAKALVEKGSATQEEINNAFNELHEAEKLFKNSIVPGIMTNIDIEMLKKEIENFKNMLNMPVGTNVGECSQEAKDALVKALDAAQALVESDSPTQEYLNRAFNALQEAGKQLKSSVTTGLMPFEYKPVTASSNFDQMIKVNIVGAGGFVENLSASNIKLCGDFEGLTVKSVVMDKEHPWEAGIELAGSLNYVSGCGTITVNAAGWNGMGTTHDITAKVAVDDPNVLNVTWPVSNDFNNYDAFIFNHRGISIGFDSDVQLPTDLSKIIVKDSKGSQVPVTSVHYINLDSKRELQIECGFITDGQYNVFIPENTLTDVSGSKHNKAINFAFKIQLPNADIDMLKNEILFAQNAVNVPVGDSVGFCPQQSIIDALKSALSDAQALVQNSNAAQEDINRVFYALQQAEQAVGASMITGMASPINNVAANANFNQTIEVNIVGGKFIPNLDPSYITLGGDFKGLIVQSVLLDMNEPWRANISLIGTLQLNTGSGTITVKGSGWNGPNENKDVTTTINVNSGEIVPQTTN